MHQQEANTRRNKWLAALMGLAMPGLGQIYNGEPIKGMSYFVILEVLYILGFRWTVLLPDKMLIFGALCTILAVVILYAMAAIDSYRKAATTSYQPAPYNRWYFYVAVWLLGWVLVSGAVFGYVRDNVIQAYKIASGSMEPAVLTGDQILADNTAYRRISPKKGDVVIFIYPNDRSKVFIKRIEGLPGDTIIGADQRGQKVPPGFIYVLGDRREDSLDSRQFGFVPLRDIIAKARQVYYSRGKDGIRWTRIGMPVQ